MNEGRDTLVLHPGSTHVRVGLASSSLPATFTQVVARRLSCPLVSGVSVPMDDSDTQEGVQEYCEEAESLIKARLKSLKLRPVPNASQQVLDLHFLLTLTLNC